MSNKIQVTQLPDQPQLHIGTAKIAAAREVPEGVVAEGRKILLHFALNLESGEEIENNFLADPVSCVIGDGNLMPGFEQVLLGLRAGAEVDRVLEPDAAFGTVNEANIQRFPCYQFPPDLTITKGLVVDFADARGYSQAGVVEEFDVRYVTINFNHPLAGRRIRFRVKLYEVV